MDQWCHTNVVAFREHGMLPSGVACITATMGKQEKSGEYTLQIEYNEL